MRSEIEQAVGYAVRANLRQQIPNMFEGLFTERPVRVLPPFNGEMGFEVIVFLARVEPYLRNGWRILARRPALYPPGAAYFDPEYFSRLDALIKQYSMFPNQVGMRNPGQYLDETLAAGIVRMDADQIALQMTCDGPDIIVRESAFELQQRDLFYSYCDSNARGVIDIDRLLLSCQPVRPQDIAVMSRPVLTPGYRPQAFIDADPNARPHVGVQLRAMAKTGKHPGGGMARDSDPAFILPLVNRVAKHLDLPILVYGHPAGTVSPEGYERTYQAGGDLLERELDLLASCRVMFAPDSGWADLMAWLRVPTLLEGSGTSGHFDGLVDFQPRIALIDRDAPIEPQVDRLLASAVMVPGDTRAVESFDQSVGIINFTTTPPR